MPNVTNRYQVLILVCLGGLLVGHTPLALADEINLTGTNLGSENLNPDIVENTALRYNNENWFVLPHPEPATVVISDTGEMYGTTTSSVPFTQLNVENSFGIRIQEFFIQDHHHYIVEGEEVYTAADLSKKIGQFYQTQ